MVRPSMEGRAIARPNPPAPAVLTASRSYLQWRAGQLPGRTWPAGQVPPGEQSFNGGPGNCPAELVSSPAYTTCLPPSMEGRAIARPNPRRSRAAPHHEPPSMEGRAIARPNPRTLATASTWSPTLQWRAGQLPGRTPPARQGLSSGPPSFNGGPGNCPAELRRIRASTTVVTGPFNGGPGNCPAELVRVAVVIWAPSYLQWRAGQLPGRTGRGLDRIRHPPDPFNGGPGNCPAELEPCAFDDVVCDTPSMEGRAIARPNTSGRSSAQLYSIGLQWRAGQLPGRTCNDTPST